MLKLISKLIIFLLAFSTLCLNFASSSIRIDLETGLVNTGYNDVRIPGDKGTNLSFKNDLTPESSFFYRISLEYSFLSGHNVSLLYAPLEMNYKGSLPKNTAFDGAVFRENEKVKAVYKFNSYRITYRYTILSANKLSLGLGLTGKIRDAGIALSSERLEKEKTNTGFVPLINFRLYLSLTNDIGFMIIGDALAAKQGRAEDVLFAAKFNVSPQLSVRLGYRILEGGADNDEVYNFAMFKYASFGLTYFIKDI